MTEVRSIHTKEAACLLRARLKRLYPATRFSVRFERYSMGSHINVSWTDGPAQRTVDEIASAFSGSRFDGSNDSTYHVRSWLLSNGEALTAIQGADGYSRGTLTEAPEANAELVQFYGSAPNCNRTISAEYEAACAKAWAGLSPRQHCTLLNHHRFPNWSERGDGYKLAWFLDATDILPRVASSKSKYVLASSAAI